MLFSLSVSVNIKQIFHDSEKNMKCYITSILRAGVEYLFYYTPNSQS